MTCPFCGCTETSGTVNWEARSTEPQDRDNTALLLEIQCHKCGMSFWVGDSEVQG